MASSSPKLKHSAADIAEWGWLPKNVLHIVLDNLVSFRDYVRFAAVCTRWHSVAVENNMYWRSINPQLQTSRPRRHQFPLLLVPSGDADEYSNNLYSVIDDAIYRLRVPMPAPFNRVNGSCGSSCGWLAFSQSLQETKTFPQIVTLVNPFSGATIRLPKLDPEEYLKFDDNEMGVHKVVLSADPASAPADFQAVAVYGHMRRLARYRAGDEGWIYAPAELLKRRSDGSTCVQKPPVCVDAVCYRGRFYAVNQWGWVVAILKVRAKGWDRSNCVYVRKRCLQWYTITRLPTQTRDFRSTLVESSEGDLLLVRRNLDESEAKVFKVRDGRGRKEGEGGAAEVKSLGDDAVFVGCGKPGCVSASSAAAIAVGGWCRGNCVYYANCGTEIGLFCLGNHGSHGKLYSHCPPHQNLPHPVWVLLASLENLLLTTN
ncbi:uncharacterized protein LOC131145680 [Malania oleifera]|uniref:uncharacterized protein LOC131145680 n=1 Tax=Malania oleifera TaxID=397392 RepID=UPI0025AE5B21|nr:uncharacterized protein LOC131145680 [Malania oleifera]